MRASPWLLAGLLASLAIAAVAAPAPPARVGINFPFRSPETAPTESFLQWLAELGAPVMRQMTYNDVHWVQVERINGGFNYTNSDLVFSNACGIRVLPTLYGISAGENDRTGLQVPWLACTNPPYAPYCGWRADRDAGVSENYVTNTVARYRGLATFWEVANEMNTKTTRPIGLPVPEFAAFMQSNRIWIRAADTNAQVVLPGLLGTYGFPMTLSTNWLHLFLNAGGQGSFDIANYHDYNSWWTLPTHFDMVRTALNAHGLQNTPIWVTETGLSSRTNSDITPRYSTEDSQAADVWRRCSLLFGKGAEYVGWHTFYSSGSSPTNSSGWDEFGVLNAVGRRKKSWHSLKLFLAQMGGFQSASLLSTGATTDDNTNGGAGVWVVSFLCSNATCRYVLWSPDNQPYALTGLTAQAYQAIRVVPDWISADGKDATFTTNRVTPTGGRFTFTLADFPIVVEPLPPSPFVLRAERSSAGQIVLVWSAMAGGTTTVETAESVAPASWASANSADFSFTQVGGEVRATDLRPVTTQRFYRLRWQLP